MRTEAKAQFSNFCEYEAPSSSYPWQAKGSGAADFAVGTMSGTTNIVGTAAEAGQLTDRTKEWPTKPSNAKETNSELGNLFEAESNKIKATPGHSKRIITKPQRYGTRKCRHATDRSQTQEPKFVGYQEILIDELPGRLSRSQPQGGSCGEAQSGAGAGAKGPAAAAAEKHLCQEGQGSARAHAGAERENEQNPELGDYEAETRERSQRYQAAAGRNGAERDLAFSQMSQEQTGDTDPEVADQFILEALTSEAAIKPIVDTWMSESAHTVLGDPTQKQAWFREQLCKHMTQLENAANCAQTTKYSRKKSQKMVRTGHRQDCARRGREHGPQFDAPGLDERLERSSSCFGLTRGNASSNSRFVHKRMGFLICICLNCINTSKYFLNSCMRDVYLFPSPELERRRLAQVATFSLWKPLTLPLSTTLSAETYCYSAEPTPFSSRNISPHKTKGPLRKPFFPKHTVFPPPTDPDSAKPAAGVGLIAAQEIRCTNPIPQTEILALFRQQGRADIYNIDMGSSTALMVVNLYGWQGAANNTFSKKKTDELIEAAQQEFDTTGIGPKIFWATSTRISAAVRP